jgi:mannose-1-phosphate guanylyltransferase/mannose-6-phosphate isomerase
MTIRPVILCGGSGTRLWPLSRPLRPKQFQPLTGSRPMLVETAMRVSAGTGESPASRDVEFDPPLVIGSVKHRHLIDKLLPECDTILEPFARNSGPAIAAATLLADPGDRLLILPADHHIKDVAAFHRAIKDAAAAVNAEKVVTFGVEPDHPATGYGYIEAQPGDTAVLDVVQFVEKPDEQTAQAYLESGNFYWNAGIFLFRADTMLAALTTFAPDMVDAVSDALRSQTGRVRLLDAAAFARAPSMSIDYAVMEPLSRIGGVSVVPVKMGWSDIGDHRALLETRALPGESHVCGPVFAHETSNCSISSDGPMVAAIGVDHLAIMVNHNRVLVADLSRAQDVKLAAGAATDCGFGYLLPVAVRERVRSWLFEEALPLWAQRAWDAQRGGFKEALSLRDPAVERGNFRRVRVQARQVYAFAHAKVLGWTGPADTLIADGLAYLYDKAWRDDLGFAHTLGRDGAIIDGRMDTYDHAFALTALAWAHRAGVAADIPARIELIVNLLDTRLAGEHGGYRNDDTGGLDLRANPHMHLLEAYLALYEAFDETRWLVRAQAIVELFERHIFDPVHDCVIEHFTPDWRAHPEQAARIEPGHAYEWAVLLAKFERHSGRDLASWRRRLIVSADARGRDGAAGFALNCVTPTGQRIDAARRLWPQLEMLRARLVEPGATGLIEAGRQIEALFASYLADAGPGLWMDEYDAAGAAVAKDVPASILYHLLSAFAPVIDGGKA